MIVLMTLNPCGLEFTKIPVLYRGLPFDEVTPVNQPATQLLLHAYHYVPFLNTKENSILPCKDYILKSFIFIDLIDHDYI